MNRATRHDHYNCRRCWWGRNWKWAVWILPIILVEMVIYDYFQRENWEEEMKHAEFFRE